MSAESSSSSSNSSSGVAENIRVCVRVRPQNARERRDERGAECVRVNSATAEVQIAPPDDSGRPPEGSVLQFDKVFAPQDSTLDLFADVEPLVDAAFNGFNTTVFCYGQTASGKTYTMLGTPDDPGLLPLAVSRIFQRCGDSDNREFVISASYLEIYNETILDLFNDGDGDGGDDRPARNKPITMLDHPQFGTQIRGATESAVDSDESLLELVAEAQSRRQVGATRMNAQSSRSHTLLRIRLEMRDMHAPAEEPPDVDEAPPPSFSSRTSDMWLVDLAGSERAAKTGARGARLREGANINKSLLTLSNVISILSKHAETTAARNRRCRPPVVPFRESKLTRLLSTSLGGNARTLLVCTLSPAGSNYAETMSTLRFGAKAKTIINTSRVNETMEEDSLLLKAKRQISDLQARITELEASTKAAAELTAVTATNEERAAQKKLDELQKLIIITNTVQQEAPHLAEEAQKNLVQACKGRRRMQSMIQSTSSLEKFRHLRLGDGGGTQAAAGTRRSSGRGWSALRQARKTGKGVWMSVRAASALKKLQSVYKLQPITEESSEDDSDDGSSGNEENNNALALLERDTKRDERPAMPTMPTHRQPPGGGDDIENKRPACDGTNCKHAERCTTLQASMGQMKNNLVRLLQDIKASKARSATQINSLEAKLAASQETSNNLRDQVEHLREAATAGRPQVTLAHLLDPLGNGTPGLPTPPCQKCSELMLELQACRRREKEQQGSLAMFNDHMSILHRVAQASKSATDGRVQDLSSALDAAKKREEQQTMLIQNAQQQASALRSSDAQRVTELQTNFNSVSSRLEDIMGALKRSRSSADTWRQRAESLEAELVKSHRQEEKEGTALTGGIAPVLPSGMPVSLAKRLDSASSKLDHASSKLERALLRSSAEKKKTMAAPPTPVAGGEEEGSSGRVVGIFSRFFWQNNASPPPDRVDADSASESSSHPPVLQQTPPRRSANWWGSRGEAEGGTGEEEQADDWIASLASWRAGTDEVESGGDDDDEGWMLGIADSVAESPIANLCSRDDESGTREATKEPGDVQQL